MEQSSPTLPPALSAAGHLTSNHALAVIDNFTRTQLTLDQNKALIDQALREEIPGFLYVILDQYYASPGPLRHLLTSPSQALSSFSKGRTYRRSITEIFKKKMIARDAENPIDRQALRYFAVSVSRPPRLSHESNNFYDSLAWITPEASRYLCEECPAWAHDIIDLLSDEDFTDIIHWLEPEDLHETITPDSPPSHVKLLLEFCIKHAHLSDEIARALCASIADPSDPLLDPLVATASSSIVIDYLTRKLSIGSLGNTALPKAEITIPLIQKSSHDRSRWAKAASAAWEATVPVSTALILLDHAPYIASSVLKKSFPKASYVAHVETKLGKSHPDPVLARAFLKDHPELSLAEACSVLSSLATADACL